MDWRELYRSLGTVLERTPALSDKPALVRHGDVLYELDLYRSMSTGVLHISAEYPGVSQQDHTTLVPEEEIAEQEDIEPVEVHATSFSGKR